MKPLLLLTLLLPTIAFAQRLQDYDVQMIRSHAYVTPKVMKLTPERNEASRSDACAFGKEILKDVSHDFQRFNCLTRPDSPLCKNLRDLVLNFAQEDSLSQYGSRVASFNLKTKQPDTALLARQFGQELNLDSERVHVLVPALDTATIQISTVQESNFFLKLLNVLSMPHSLYIDGQTLVSQDRLSTCAFKEKALILSGYIEAQHTVATDRPLIEIYSLYNFYHGVANDWARIEGKNWKNPLHQILYISNILQENMKRYQVESLYSMEQLYDVIYASHIEQDEFSIYLNKFKDMNEFASKVHPPFQDELKFSVQLVQN